VEDCSCSGTLLPFEYLIELDDLRRQVVDEFPFFSFSGPLAEDILATLVRLIWCLKNLDNLSRRREPGDSQDDCSQKLVMALRETLNELAKESKDKRMTVRRTPSTFEGIMGVFQCEHRIDAMIASCLKGLLELRMFKSAMSRVS
jgi:hypothetical protein